VTGLMVCDDLIFTSRVTATARAPGDTVLDARSVDQANQLAQQTPPSCVIIDLHTAGAGLQALLAGLRRECPTMPRTIAYGSHVNQDLLQAARDAGCDRVLPRGQFVKVLEAELPGWLSGAKPHADDADFTADEQ
jgi:DNA-binding NarL/FixJ family response regulator